MDASPEPVLGRRQAPTRVRDTTNRGCQFAISPTTTPFAGLTSKILSAVRT
jgi:hypothetical protein